MDKRDQTIDILRCIALLAIFLAHVNPPDYVFRLRNFDVVLMVMCMTWSYVLSRSKRDISYSQYILKRFKRLIVPTWAYLTLLFGLGCIMATILGRQFMYSRSDIVMGYFLLNKVGYIWIMRVYFYIAILSPGIYSASKKIKSNLIYFGILALVYLAYKGLYLLGKCLDSSFIYDLYDIAVLQFIGWGIVAAITIRLLNLIGDKTKYAVATCAFSSIFVLEMWLNKSVTIQNFKYPPALYYISYGVSVGLVLYELVKYINSRINSSNRSSRFLTFISKNSMELYFCQALLLEIINHYFSFSFKDNYILYWLFLIITSMTIIYIYKRCTKQSKF